MNAAMHRATEGLHATARARVQAKEFADAVEASAAEMEEFLRRELTERPYQTLALVAGAGYILGGGLPTRMTRLLFSFGTRVAMAILARELTAAFGPDTPPSAQQQH